MHTDDDLLRAAFNIQVFESPALPEEEARLVARRALTAYNAEVSVQVFADAFQRKWRELQRRFPSVPARRIEESLKKVTELKRAALPLAERIQNDTLTRDEAANQLQRDLPGFPLDIYGDAISSAYLGLL